MGEGGKNFGIIMEGFKNCSLKEGVKIFAEFCKIERDAFFSLIFLITSGMFCSNIQNKSGMLCRITDFRQSF